MKRYELPVPGSELKLPVIVLEGEAGNTCLITAGVHGAEFASILAALRVAGELEESQMTGTVMIAPLCNPQAFYQFERQVVPEDRKNLNRMFPGKEDGTLAERLAYLMEKELFRKADYYMDLHGGDIQDRVMPFVFYPSVCEEEVSSLSAKMAQVPDMTVRVRSRAVTGAYNYAATQGIPSILMERGGAAEWDDATVDAYVRDIKAVLAYLEIYPVPEKKKHADQTEVTETCYHQAEQDGFWYPFLKPGEYFEKDQLLGCLKNLNGDILQEVYASFDGIILYQAVCLGVKEDDEIIACGKVDFRKQNQKSLRRGK